jgi:protocatechuate 3,4-dioxygenase beta subunit
MVIIMTSVVPCLAELREKSYSVFMKMILCYIFVLMALMSAPETVIRNAFAATCTPTEVDALGPFYKPDAPSRTSVGKGYVLQGVVRSSKDCRPVPGAKIELWLAGPDGKYDDAHRATIITDASAAYRFESNLPPPYFGRPPHIHLRLSAKGFETLVTQHYPAGGTVSAVFDIVLVPAK